MGRRGGGSNNKGKELRMNVQIAATTLGSSLKEEVETTHPCAVAVLLLAS